ncbi:ABC transporter permease, partial [Brucella sp. 21LCYQ03]|nr:ABC transporter permease [Brucella sp. 21LCYQ03]
MLKHYFTIALRNLKKNKAFTAINIVGLAIGMAGCLMIALWLQNMLRMDRYHKKGDRVYIISNRDDYEGSKFAWINTPKILGEAMGEEFADLDSYSRYGDDNHFLTTYQHKKIKTNTSFVDPGFFDLFDLPLVSGEKRGLLKDPMSIVLTESKAKAL